MDLYCKSYCPLHPGVHKIVFALVDELLDVFEASDFHAGMDEVFYIGMEECPRWSGHVAIEMISSEMKDYYDDSGSDGVKEMLSIFE